MFVITSAISSELSFVLIIRNYDYNWLLKYNCRSNINSLNRTLLDYSVILLDDSIGGTL